MITVFENNVFTQTPDNTTKIITTKSSPYLLTNTPNHFAFITEEAYFNSHEEEEFYSLLTVYDKSSFKKVFSHEFMESDANWMTTFSDPNEIYIGFVNYIYKYNIELEHVSIVAHKEDIMFSSMCIRDDKIITLSRNGLISIWDEDHKHPQREYMISNQKMTSAIYTIDSRYFVWSHTTASRKQGLYLFDEHFNIIQQVELSAGTFSYMYKLTDNVFIGVKHWIKTKEIVIIRIGEEISIQYIPFTGRFVEPVIPQNDKLLVDKRTSYEWFNIHTYEMEPCKWLNGNISFYILSNQ